MELAKSGAVDQSITQPV
ncbi:hypothetical protein A2U01_0106122, partial [Trifolium medium]|nr:hypothetical protein [Trifolium medium]